MAFQPYFIARLSTVDQQAVFFNLDRRQTCINRRIDNAQTIVLVQRLTQLNKYSTIPELNHRSDFNAAMIRTIMRHPVLNGRSCKMTLREAAVEHQLQLLITLGTQVIRLIGIAGINCFPERLYRQIYIFRPLHPPFNLQRRDPGRNQIRNPLNEIDVLWRKDIISIRARLRFPVFERCVAKATHLCTHAAVSGAVFYLCRHQALSRIADTACSVTEHFDIDACADAFLNQL